MSEYLAGSVNHASPKDIESRAVIKLSPKIRLIYKP
jgi:hypothetical protein